MRILITTIGKMDGYQPLEYYYLGKEDKVWKGKVAGIAAAVLDKRFDKMLVFFTKKTGMWKTEYRKLCSENDLPSPTFKEIPAGSTNEEQWTIVESVINSILEITKGFPAYLTLDITPGFRLMPLLYFAAVGFLTTFNNSVLKRVIYSEVDNEKRIAKILDVTSSFEVIEWYHAANVFTKTDNVDGLIRLVERRKKELIALGINPREIDPIRKGLNGIYEYSTSALPIELGLKCKSVQQLLDGINDSPQSLPLIKHLLDELRTILDNCTIDSAKHKKSLLLNPEEIDREMYIIKRSFDQGEIFNALAMFRETFVNRVLLILNPTKWIDWTARNDATTMMNALAKRAIDNTLRESLTPNELQIGLLWDKLTLARNKIAHCGYSNDEINIQTLKTQTTEILQDFEMIDFSCIVKEKPRTRLLVSPIGKSKGALFSALHHSKPDGLLVLTSKETDPFVEEVLSEMDAIPKNVMREMLENPFSAFKDIKEIAKRWQEILVSYDTIQINIVGGTTLMGELARAIGREAMGLGIPTMVFAVIDSRDNSTQLNNPYVVSEYVEIECWPKNIGEIHFEQDNT